MRARWPVVVVVLAAAVGFAWLLSWQPSSPAATSPAEAPSQEDAPSAEAAAPGPATEPEIAAAAEPANPKPEVTQAEPAPEAVPMDEPREKPDVSEILNLPEHLEDAAPSEQRRYREQLLAHQEIMLSQARLRLSQLEKLGGKETEVEEVRWGIEDAEAAVEVLREHLAAD
jgi:hypothetical protein